MSDPTSPSAPAAPIDPALLARLAELRDLEVPAPAGWWPPAPGWWALAALLILLTLLAARALRARHHKRRYRREALEALRQARARWEADRDGLAFATTTDQLIRRVAIHRLGRERVARLTGEAFSERINALSGRALSPSTATMLTQTRYRPRLDPDGPPDAGIDVGIGVGIDVARVEGEVAAWLEALEPDRA